MTKNNNLIPTNKAPIETVYELKDYEIKRSPLSPAARSKVINKNGSNYLSGNEGYGPCSSCSGSNRDKKFKLKIVLKNCMSGELGITTYNTDSADKHKHDIRYQINHWRDRFLCYFSEDEREKLFDKITEKVDEHKRGYDVDTTVCNKCSISNPPSRSSSPDRFETITWDRFGFGFD